MIAKDKDVKAGLTELPAPPPANPTAEDMRAAVDEIARLRALLEQSRAAKAEPAPLPSQPGQPGRRFHVKLKDCPIGHVTAVDAHEAQAKYERYCGILGTANKFEVHELSPETAAADAAQVKGKPGLMGQIHEIA